MSKFDKIQRVLWNVLNKHLYVIWGTIVVSIITIITGATIISTILGYMLGITIVSFIK